MTSDARTEWLVNVLVISALLFFRPQQAVSRSRGVSCPACLNGHNRVLCFPASRLGSTWLGQGAQGLPLRNGRPFTLVHFERLTFISSSTVFFKYNKTYLASASYLNLLTPLCISL